HEVRARPSPEAAAALRTLDLSTLREDGATAFARERDHLLRAESFPLLDEYRAYLGTASLLDYLPSNGLLVLDEPSSLASMVAALTEQAAEVQVDLAARGEAPPHLQAAFPAWDTLLAQAARGPWERLALALDPTAPGPFAHAPSYSGRLQPF